MNGLGAGPGDGTGPNETIADAVADALLPGASPLIQDPTATGPISSQFVSNSSGTPAASLGAELGCLINTPNPGGALGPGL